MYRRLQKGLSLLLTLAMFCTILTVPASAAGALTANVTFTTTGFSVVAVDTNSASIKYSIVAGSIADIADNDGLANAETPMDLSDGDYPLVGASYTPDIDETHWVVAIWSDGDVGTTMVRSPFFYDGTTFKAYTPQSSLVFDVQGGTYSGEQAGLTVSVDANTTLDPASKAPSGTFTKAGNKFLGWSANAGGTSAGDIASSITTAAESNSLTVYAVWAPKTAPSASNFEVTGTYTYTGSEQQATVAAKSGVNGTGAVTITSTKKTDADTYDVTFSVAEGTDYAATSSDLTLNAAWTIQTKGVILSVTDDSLDTTVGSTANVDAEDNITVAGLTKGDANGYALTYSVTDAGTTGMTGLMSNSTTPSPSATGTATIQVTATLQGTATTNYTFGADGTSTTTANDNISVVVAAGLFTVSFNGNGSTGGSTASMANQAIGSTSIITANGFTRTGYAFKGWAYTSSATTAAVAAGAALNTLTKNNGDPITDGATVTLYAVWAPTYTVTVNAGTGGTASDTTNSAPYEKGTSVNIVATANTGYAFDSWAITTGTGALGSASSATTTYTVGDENAVLTANFTPNALTWDYVNTNGTAGTAISVAAPTLQSGTDAASGTAAYVIDSVDDGAATTLAAYGLTLNADGTITGTSVKKGTLTVTVKVTGKNGNESTTAGFTITIGAADLTVTGQTAVSKTTSEVSGLKIADFIATATPLLGTDSIATLFTAAVTPTAGVFTGNGVKITFYTDDTRATPDASMNALPTAAGTYYYKVESDTSATQSGVPNANYNLLDFADANGVLTVTTPPPPPSGGGTSSYTVTYDMGEHGALAQGAEKTEKVERNKAPNAPAIVAAAGYKFMGWSTDGKTVLDMTKEKVSKAVTYKAVYAAYDHKPYMVGIGEGVFAPTGTLTRAEAATMLSRLTPGFVEGTAYTNDFADAQDGWYVSYIGFAAANGIAFGVGDGLFQPMRTITRGEFAAMLARFMGLEPATDLSDCPFSDCSGHWTEGYILALHRAGVLDGLEDGTVQPDRSITREEAAKMVNVAIGRAPSKAQMDKTMGEYTNPYGDVSVDLWSFYHIMEASVKHVSGDFHGEN